MALGDGFLPLLLLLGLLPAVLVQEDAPATTPMLNLTALIPAAAEATVAAGYVPSGGNTSEQAKGEGFATMPDSAQGTSGGLSKASTPGKLSILIEGDTHFQWEQWSAWHCNCAQGSMSRVRDITYSAPGVVLDPAQYDVLRFQRVVCNYSVCHCQPELRQCDRPQVSCKEEEHVCALRDIEEDQREKRKDFWARVHQGLSDLWQSLQEAFPRSRKGSTPKSES